MNKSNKFRLLIDKDGLKAGSVGKYVGGYCDEKGIIHYTLDFDGRYIAADESQVRRSTETPKVIL